MSIRTLIELNHDLCPKLSSDEELLAWAKAMASYMRSGDRDQLPSGVTFKWMRHHSYPCPFDEPLEFERRCPRAVRP